MIATEINRDQYARFVTADPASLVFHDPQWIDAVARCYGITAIYLGLFTGERLVGVLPVYARRMWLFKLYGSPLRQTGTPPGVPILAPHDRAVEVFDALRRWYRARRISHFQLTWKGPILSGKSSALRIEELDNLEIDVTHDVEANWKILSELARRMVRRAIRSGVKVHWATGAGFAERYQALLVSTYGRQGLRPNFPAAMYRELGVTLPAKRLRVLYASIDGRIVAAVWLLCSPDRCHYWDAASLQEGKDLAAGHILVWEIIRWATATGLKKVDMVGTSVGGRGGSRPGIGRFKRSFGAVAVPYNIVYWQTYRMRSLMFVYRVLAAVRRRLASWRTRGFTLRPKQVGRDVV